MGREVPGSDVAIPTPKTESRYERYNQSAKGKARRATENKSRISKREVAYLNREFCAWDGEGITETDGSHTYLLLANSRGLKLVDRQGIGTVAILEAILSADKSAVHIIYGGGYDFNMWLKDLDVESLTNLYKEGHVYWRDYFIEWRGGKSLRVRRSDYDKTVTIYDVLPFFQKSFVDACDEYLGKDWPNRDEIIREKANRGSFQLVDLETIDEYNQSELSTLVNLANELKERLFKVDIRVSRWDGPGAIATSLYQKYGVKQNLSSAPASVSEAGRYAYAGGRFEIIRKGHSERRAYQYDIRSAYPSAIRNLPCLAHGNWIHIKFPKVIAPFGMYRIQVTDPPTESATQPQPLWHRNKDGTVFFSEYPHGWYWSPEAELITEIGGAFIHEAWVYETKCGCDPFSFVEPLYNKRAALKKANDGAHVGLKLGLNSLYGKLAQQVGWSPGPPLRLPPYHSLEWAGYITSHCRSQVFRASLLAPDDIIAFETDAVFSRSKLALPLGERLGEWDETVYESLTYLKSGMYFGTQIMKDGTRKEVEKCRGINKGSIQRQDVIDALQAERRGFVGGILEAEQTRFITIGQALHTDIEKWRRWITGPRNIAIALNGKRIDLVTEEPYAETDDGWSETQGGFHATEFSFPYEVEWIEKTEIADPNGRALPDVRRDDAHEQEWY